jgi:RHS repeat-associated protein
LTNITFIYDGDGNRVKSIYNGTSATYFVGNYYEVTGNTVTKYYYAGTQRIVMRVNGILYFILSDQLGSVTLTTDALGNVLTKEQYTAWGDVRYSSGNDLSNYTYTGQYSYTNSFGLMYYNARWYDPSIGRFAQADTVVPSGVQGMDRYAYVNNNPVNATDPTGHHCADEDGNGNCPGDPGYDGGSDNPPYEPISEPISTGGSGGNDDGSYFYEGMSYAEILFFLQTQVDGSGCGPTSLAMAANLFGGSNSLKGGEMEKTLEDEGLKLPGLGMPPSWVTTQMAFLKYSGGEVNYQTNSTIADLKNALLHNELPVVNYANQTNGEIEAGLMGKGPLTVGHYMVAVGFNKSGIYFLDPGWGVLHPHEPPQLNYILSKDFASNWTESNMFIPAGAMFTISHGHGTNTHERFKYENENCLDDTDDCYYLGLCSGYGS